MNIPQRFAALLCLGATVVLATAPARAQEDPVPATGTPAPLPLSAVTNLVIPKLHVENTNLKTLVARLNQQIRRIQPDAAPETVKLNRNLTHGDISVNFRTNTVLDIVQVMAEVCNVPYFIRDDGIWLGAPNLPVRKMSAEELARFQEMISTLSPEELIDLFTDTREQGLGSHATALAGGFAAVEMAPVFQGGVLGSAPPVVSPVMRELVRRGSAALPALIAHLQDARETSLIVGADGFLSALWLSDEYDPRNLDPHHWPAGVNEEAQQLPGPRHVDYYVLKVGDECFEAIGQIVNRNLRPLRYQPTACLVINSPVMTPALARAVEQEWGGCTSDELRQALVQDVQSDEMDRSSMALVRLCLYYPETGEPLVLEQLRRPLSIDQAELINRLGFMKSGAIDRAVLDLARRAADTRLDDSEMAAALQSACKNRLAGSMYENEWRQLPAAAGD